MYIDVFLDLNQAPVRIDSELFHSLSQQISRSKEAAPNAYYLNQAEFKAVITDDFIGDVQKGGACNCEDITFNAHGNGTHTECVGHVSKESIYMDQVIMPPYLTCHLVHANAKHLANGDLIVDLNSYPWQNLTDLDAVIIHSGTTHKAEQFSGTNPCYIDKQVLRVLNEKGINHVLTDLPSVDREEDGGALAGHKVFFGYPEGIHLNKTITELLFVPPSIETGKYLLSINYAAMETDAVPASIKIYPIFD